MPYLNQPKEQIRAREAVRSAVERGFIVKPTACENCGRPDYRGSDGRSLLQGHHHAGHQEVLAVTWLCVKCHRSETPSVKGERHHASKLAQADVDAIRASPLSARRLGLHYGVHHKTVMQIRRGEIWASSPPDQESRT